MPIVGVDLSAPMLEKLVEKAGGRAPLALVLADATALPFGADRFGAVVIRHVLHLIPAWERAVQELVRVLEPGGVVLFSRGDIPRAWREVTDRFLEIVGPPSFASALAAWDEGAVDAAFARTGATTRSLPAFEERLEQSLDVFLDQMAEGLQSWTWEAAEPARRAAVDEVRGWALERFGTLDPPGSRDVTIEWRAYDLG